jgi:DNA-directed RNA polymerase subunit E'/Rpb7
MSSKSLKSITRPTKNTKEKKISTPISTTTSTTTSTSSTDTESSDSTEYTSQNIKINELIDPCKDKILYTKIILNPNQMNNDIYINLKKNLIDKLEGKCITDGYVIKIYKILEYTDGVIDGENFTGAAVFNIKYLAKICVAIRETTIIAKITEYLPNANFALAEYGNIIKIIFTKNERDINNQIFIITNDKNIVHLRSQKKLQVNDYVKLQLKTIRYYHNDIYIKCMAFLDDFPTLSEIEKYAHKEDAKVVYNIDNKSMVYYNDDNEVIESNITQTNTMSI